MTQSGFKYQWLISYRYYVYTDNKNIYKDTKYNLAIINKYNYRTLKIFIDNIYFCSFFCTQYCYYFERKQQPTEYKPKLMLKTNSLECQSYVHYLVLPEFLYNCVVWHFSGGFVSLYKIL